MQKIAIIRNDTIINVTQAEDLEEVRWILEMIWPDGEFVYLDSLPEGAWIGWYRVDGVWIDNDPPTTSERIAAAKAATNAA